MLPNALSQWLSGNKVIIELMLAGLVAISVLANYFTTGSPTLLMISMFLLAAFYFITAYLVPEVNGVWGVISTKVIAISSAVCVIGLLFTVLKWQGAEQMLLIGTQSMAFAGLILLVNSIRSWNTKYLPLLVRVLILGAISASTLLTTMNSTGKI
ncbi:MAG TPA: hypothetical protein VFW11_14755 [Cyclobacteriaceae bacterium]|nr:hypothetical protein [Cyclobacteriaceae bacterium]